MKRPSSVLPEATGRGNIAIELFVDPAGLVPFATGTSGLSPCCSRPTVLAFAATAALARAALSVRIPGDFILFALTLLGVALFHHHTLAGRATGFAAIVIYKLGSPASNTRRPRWLGAAHGARVGDPRQPVPTADGFALLSRHFEESKLPDVLPAFLPDDWKGAFALLVSSRAVELPRQHRGGTDWRRDGSRGVPRKVHIGYLAAIVAASNAGGAGSVVGDTTTTMMWIAGVSPLSVVEAYVRCGRDLHLRHPGRDPAARIPDHEGCAVGVRVDWARV